MKCFCGIFLPVTYVAVAFLTFAWAYETYVPTKTELEYGRRAPGEFGPLMAGIFWPIYWGGTGALGAVRYAKSPRSELMCKDAAGNVWRPDESGVCTVRAQ